MSLHKIDQKGINKLKKLYNIKLLELKKENQILNLKLQDKKETLKLNQDLLQCTLRNLFEKNDETDENKEEEEDEEEKNDVNNNIEKLIERNKKLNEKISLLMESKAEKEKKVDIIKKEMPGIQEKIIGQINTLNTQSEQRNKEILTEENTIKKLKAELSKLRLSAFFKKARTEILVAPPSKNSVEFNMEYIKAQNLFSKASKMHKDKKKISEDIWKKEKNLKEEMKKLKISVIKTKNIEQKEENDYLEYLGYNLLADKFEKEEEEESEESESSSDDNNGGGGGDKKKKEKELNDLNDRANKLKKKIEDFEKKINQYKKIYRNYKSKIEKMKQKEKKK